MPVTTAGTDYTLYPFTSSYGENAWRAVGDNFINNPNIPTVLFCHGNPGAAVSSADQQFTNGYTTLREWLIDHGWAYIEGHGAGANWGNQNSRDAYEAMITDTISVWSIGRIVVIGRSMGALVGAWLASKSQIVSPKCAGFISLSGTADLTNRYSKASGSDMTNMQAAYGISNDTEWRAAVSNFDPLLESVDIWTGLNAQMQWDTSDTAVPYADNGYSWDLKYGPKLAIRRRITTDGGDHNSTPNNPIHINGSILFLEDAGLPGVWRDLWTDSWGGEEASSGSFNTSITYGPIEVVAASDSVGDFESYLSFGPVEVVAASGSVGDFESYLSFGPVDAESYTHHSATFNSSILFGPAIASGTSPSIGPAEGEFSTSVEFGPIALSSDRTSKGDFSSFLAYGPSEFDGKSPNVDDATGNFTASYNLGPVQADGRVSFNGDFTVSYNLGPVEVDGRVSFNGYFGTLIEFGPVEYVGESPEERVSIGEFETSLKFDNPETSGFINVRALFETDITLGPATFASSSSKPKQPFDKVMIGDNENVELYIGSELIWP